jgi:hypothetical protein
VTEGLDFSYRVIETGVARRISRSRRKLASQQLSARLRAETGPTYVRREGETFDRAQLFVPSSAIGSPKGRG